MARWKAHGRLSIRINWTFFRYSLWLRSYEGKYVQLGCFRRGSTSLHSNFTWSGLSPSTILSTRKLETLGYPKVKTASLCVTSFWQCRSVTDGQTDGRICCRIYSACKASFAACCKNEMCRCKLNSMFTQFTAVTTTIVKYRLVLPVPQWRRQLQLSWWCSSK